MPLLLTPNAPYISIKQKSHVKIKLMLKIKNFSFRSQTNGIDDLEYILATILSQYQPLTPITKETVAILTITCPFIPHTQYHIYHISTNEKSDIKIKLMLKIKNLLFRSHTNDINYL